VAVVAARRVRLRHKAARVWTGGAGECLLLLHGGWAGAPAYWSCVWQDLADRFFVVAPELPGIADAEEAPLATVGVYGLWLDELLESLDIERAWVVGNSFGAMVAWRFAAQAPHRCRGLVMVNGFPAPSFSMILSILIRRTPLRRLALMHLRRHTYSRQALRAGFPDPVRVPPELAATLAGPPDKRRMDAMLDLLLSGEAPGPAPALPSLVLWGAADRLPRCDADAARALAASLPDCELALLPGAGHLPQCDSPEKFTATLSHFVAARTAGPTSA
jgi:pimeloyl-ACP methyl ester carboxylesterase